MMIIGIDMGHTISGPNYGAVGIVKESEETRTLGNRIIKYLEDMGHKVVNCTVDKASSTNDSLKKRSAKANAQKLDLFVSIHFNKSKGGYGSEIYTYNANKLPQAINVLEGLNNLGFTNSTKDKLSRGIKNGAGLSVIRNTKATAMLIEVCFIDSSRDVDLYKANIDKIARIIAEGLIGQIINIDNGDDDMIPDTVKLAACKDNPIAPKMIEEIKVLQKVIGLKEDRIAREELVRKLPELTGTETRGIVTVMQRILIMKGFLSSGSATGVIGNANKDAITRLKEAVGIPSGGLLIDKNTWRKILEY